MKITLNEEWSELLEQYKDDHQDSRNQLCHSIGIPMIAASLPIGATVVGLPLAIPLFGVGWGFQFVGTFLKAKSRLLLMTSASCLLVLLGGRKRLV